MCFSLVQTVLLFICFALERLPTFINLSRRRFLCFSAVISNLRNFRGEFDDVEFPGARSLR